jgi:hypothetical protein
MGSKTSASEARVGNMMGGEEDDGLFVVLWSFVSVWGGGVGEYDKNSQECWLCAVE